MAGEISFWEQVRTVHPQWFATGMDKATPLDQDVGDLAFQCRARPVRILDLGCGMFSTMGYASRYQEPVEFYYADPLAVRFREIADQQGFRLPIDIDTVEAEELDLYAFPPFSVIYARNSLDHCHDAASALEACAAMLMPGGSLVLRHYLRCADRNHHESLHQWNFFDESGEMWLEGYGKTRRVVDLVGPCEQVVIERYTEGPETLLKAIYRNPYE